MITSRLWRQIAQPILAAALLGSALPAIAQTSLPLEPSPTPNSIPSLPIPTSPASGFEGNPATIFENITLTPKTGSQPETLRGISGGTEAASDLAGRSDTATGPCSGFVDQPPDHRIFLTQYFDFLSLQVQSSDDTTLVVRGPGGIWCNDNYSGKNPGMAGQWFSGVYEVWVGSPSENAFYPYVIRLSEQQ